MVPMLEVMGGKEGRWVCSVRGAVRLLCTSKCPIKRLRSSWGTEKPNRVSCRSVERLPSLLDLPAYSWEAKPRRVLTGLVAKRPGRVGHHGDPWDDVW